MTYASEENFGRCKMIRSCQIFFAWKVFFFAYFIQNFYRFAYLSHLKETVNPFPETFLFQISVAVKNLNLWQSLHGSEARALASLLSFFPVFPLLLFISLPIVTSDELKC